MANVSAAFDLVKLERIAVQARRSGASRVGRRVLTVCHACYCRLARYLHE